MKINLSEIFSTDTRKNLFSISLAAFVVIIFYSASDSFGSSTIIQMQDTVQSYGATTNSANQLQSEFISSTSSLVGKSIDTISIDLNKVGSPSGTIQVGVFKSDLSLKQSFGTKDSSTLTTSSSKYSFSLPSGQTYLIQSGDRIGIKFTGSSSSNYVDISIDQTNSFDGTNSYYSYYTNSWQSSTGKDLAMTLTLNGSSVFDVSSSPPGGTYSSPQSITIIATQPSTIYYTKNGSNPNLSSSNGPSPISGIAINTNTTLKFFAKTGSGNTTSIKSAVYTIIIPKSSGGISVKAPPDILSVTTNSSRNISNLGTPTVTDKFDSNPTITNNAPKSFPIGVTKVTWTATDSKGHSGQALQKVTVISASPPVNQFNRVAMINFDDDFASEYILGKPILDKYNIKVTLYVICGKVNEQNYMTWSMIHSMQSDGQDIQAHTMNHLNSNLLTQSQLDYEYGKDIACLKNNGTSGVHVVAIPFNEGFDNPKVINTIAKYFDFARGINREAPNTFYLHCNEPEAHETNCKTYSSSGHLNLFNRYTIPAWSSDLTSISDNFNDTKSFAQFIKEVNKASTNTGSIPIEIPVVYYHRVVINNSAIPNVSQKGTSTMLLDAEMKYLVDNHFKIRTTKDLGYDTTKNWFFFKS